jgi:hypothetical protein
LGGFGNNWHQGFHVKFKGEDRLADIKFFQNSGPDFPDDSEESAFAANLGGLSRLGIAAGRCGQC